MGIFDQFISARLLDRYPQLYQLGQKGEFVSIKIIAKHLKNKTKYMLTDARSSKLVISGLG